MTRQRPTFNIGEQRHRTGYGLLLWAIILMGYFVFVFDWVVMNSLQGAVGKSGWLDFYFDVAPSTTITQAVNYSITAMRGLGSIGAGYLITKVGHKYAVLIAMALLSLALPTVFMPYYSLFVIGRMFMATGGTVMIIYTQPVISRFFAPKGRAVLSLINGLGFNFGTALPLIIFMDGSIATSLQDNWQLFAGLVGAIPLALLITYAIFGKQIDIVAPTNKELAKDELKKSGLGAVLRDKNTWKFISFYSAWLVAVVAPILIMKNNFANFHGRHYPAYANWETNLPIVGFLIGLVPGIWLIGWVTRTAINRRTWLSLVTSLGTLAMLGAYLFIAFSSSVWGVVVCMFVGGICFWGAQGVLLTIPHELKGNNPQRVAIMIGSIWGVGYLLYTLANILLAVIFDSLSGDTAVWAQFGVYIAITALCPVLALILPRTRDQKLRTYFRR